MERTARPLFRNHQRLAWIAIVHAAVVIVVLYPTLHEGLGARLFLWNSIPPTLGLLAVATAFEKSRARMIVSATFAAATAIVAIFFSATWLFSPLDLDPHSITTKLVFVFAPVVSLGLALLAAVVAWLVARDADVPE